MKVTNPGNRGNIANLKGGRRAGIPNKMTKYAKENIQKVFEELGGVDGMVIWAREKPDLFYAQIYPRLLPLEVKAQADVSMVVQVVRFSQEPE